MNEAETRAELIDPLLDAAGWGVVEGKGSAGNGLGVYAIDMASSEEGPVATFPSPEELWARTFAEENAWRDRFTSKQRLFLDFVLQHYITMGVQELTQEKLPPLLRLRYQNSIADAIADLGRPEEIGRLFSGFQRYLYLPSA